MTTYTTETKPRVGDMADHRSGQLDPRPVTRVEGDWIWIDINGSEVGPVAAGNYEFQRAHP